MKRLVARAALNIAIAMVWLVGRGNHTGGYGLTACEAENGIRFFRDLYYK